MKFQPRTVLLGAALVAMLAIADIANAQLEEIVVTAQKREQNLNDVGISISAITGSQMKELGISDAAG